MKTPRVARARYALLALTATLALSGCVPGTPTAPPTSPGASSTPSAEPSASPSPTPTPAPELPVENAADLGTWVIDGNGIGPIDIGPDASVLDTYLPGLTHTECAISSWQRADGLVIAPVTGFEHDQIHGVNMSSDSATPLADAPRTAAGIGIGSTEAEVSAAYPGVALVDDGFRPPNFPVPLDGRFVIIIMQDDLVSAFAVSAHDSLPSDYC